MRRPFLVDLYGSDLRNGEKDAMGGRVLIPIGDHLFWAVSYDEIRASSQVSGLREEDVLALGIEKIRSVGTGISFGW